MFQSKIIFSRRRRIPLFGIAILITTFAVIALINTINIIQWLKRLTNKSSHRCGTPFMERHLLQSPQEKSSYLVKNLPYPVSALQEEPLGEHRTDELLASSSWKVVEPHWILPWGSTHDNQQDRLQKECIVRLSHYRKILPLPQQEDIFLPRKSTNGRAPGGNNPTKHQTIKDIRHYFHYLETPQEICRKMVMLGGDPTCDRTNNFFDGNKIVCLDPELEIPPGKHPGNCLTLSFGVNLDTSFDSAMADLPCEVHMFDLLDFSPNQLLKKRHVHFHKIGLAEKLRTNFYVDINESLPVNSLDGLLVNNGLIGRPIHVLKMDIESDEWDIFKHLVRMPLLDAVGQISMEVHAEGLLGLSPEKQLAFMQRRYNILKDIERRGFRLSAYWPNHQPRGYRDEKDGRHYDLCGEVLYINSNWYNSTFKSSLKDLGFKFR